MKESLIVNLGKVSDVEGMAAEHDTPPETKLLRYDFVLITNEESDRARHENAVEQAQRQGGNLKVINGVLLPAEN